MLASGCHSFLPTSFQTTAGDQLTSKCCAHGTPSGARSGVSNLLCDGNYSRKYIDAKCLLTQTINTTCARIKAMTVRLCGCRITNCGYTAPYLSLSGTLALAQRSNDTVDRQLDAKNGDHVRSLTIDLVAGMTRKVSNNPHHVLLLHWPD